MSHRLLLLSFLVLLYPVMLWGQQLAQEPVYKIKPIFVDKKDNGYRVIEKYNALLQHIQKAKEGSTYEYGIKVTTRPIKFSKTGTLNLEEISSFPNGIIYDTYMLLKRDGSIWKDQDLIESRNKSQKLTNNVLTLEYYKRLSNGSLDYQWHNGLGSKNGFKIIHIDEKGNFIKKEDLRK